MTKNQVQLWRRAILVAAVAAFTLALSPATASGNGPWHDFDRWDAATPSPTGQSVAVECNPADTTSPETWPEASARFKLLERDGHSSVTFDIRDARPYTLYTVWLRLAGVDSAGNAYGGSPLVGIPVTPLVASDELADQLAFTLPHPGSAEVTNGFITDDRGNGGVSFTVDFPITSGAYPFQRFPGFADLQGDIALTNDANVERLGGESAAIKPVAIAGGSQAPATLLIASHCTDEVAHGLLPGPHENWFTWSLEE